MSHERTFRGHTVRTTAALAAMIVCPAVLLSQGAAYEPDLEPESAALTSLASTGAERSPDVEALHRARAAGDEAAMRALEAKLGGSAAPSGPRESEGDTTLRPTTTIGGAGVPAGLDGDSGIQAGDPPFTGGDVAVRSSNIETAEFSHCMASASNGTMYVAWQDDYFSHDYIQVYASDDGGATWYAFGHVLDGNADLTHPSIAVGEGTSGDTVLLAYIRDDGSGLPVPEVATAGLTPGVFTPHSVPIWNWWEGYDKPVIHTDSCHWSSWYAYLTCEGIYDSAANNVNVCTWRSSDGGSSWTDEFVPFGDYDGFAWVDPDLGYGTLLERVFLVTYCEDDLTIYTMSSDAYATTWNAEVPNFTHLLLPLHDTDPEIEAAVNYDNVMLASTYQSGVGSAGENIGYSYSTNGGDGWTAFYVLPDSIGLDEYAVSLTANEGGGSWHLAYTSGQDHAVRYAHRPQSLSSLFLTGPWIYDDEGMAGSHDTYSRKGIASGWYTDRVCIAWADARDNQFGDYDTYVDFEGNVGLMNTQRMVGPNEAASVEFLLNAGAANAGRKYLMVGTFSGTYPGTTLPGGLATVPINPDDFTMLTLTTGPPVFTGFFGILDSNGTASATLNIPASVGLPPGEIMHYAYALMGPWDFASNAVALGVSF